MHIVSPNQYGVAPQSTQSGVTLIEVMIAMLVIALGLLGMSSMQMTSVKSNQSAYLRSQSIWLANDIIDRVRSAPVDAENGDYDGSSAATNPASCAGGGLTDRQDWDCRLFALIGDTATGLVQTLDTDADGDIDEIVATIQWNDDRGRIRAASDAVTSRVKSFVYRAGM